MSIWGNVAAAAALQPDWTQTDETRSDFIRNKPDLSGIEQDMQELRQLAAGALSAAGGTMSGDIGMGGFRVTGLGLPQEAADAATKAYVDEAVQVARYLQILLAADGWTQENGIFTQRIYWEGITGEDRPHYGVLYTGSRETDLALKEAFALVDDLETGENSLLFSCFEEAPSVDIPVQLELLRSAAPAETAALLYLGDDAGAAVLAQVEGTAYSVENASLNTEPTDGVYDFTVE